MQGGMGTQQNGKWVTIGNFHGNSGDYQCNYHICNEVWITHVVI